MRREAPVRIRRTSSVRAGAGRAGGTPGTPCEAFRALAQGARLSALHRGILALRALGPSPRGALALRASIRPPSGATSPGPQARRGRTLPSPKALPALGPAPSAQVVGVHSLRGGSGRRIRVVVPEARSPGSPEAGLQARRAGAAPASAIGMPRESALVRGG